MNLMNIPTPQELEAAHRASLEPDPARIEYALQKIVSEIVEGYPRKHEFDFYYTTHTTYSRTDGPWLTSDLLPYIDKALREKHWVVIPLNGDNPGLRVKPRPRRKIGGMIPCE